MARKKVFERESVLNRAKELFWRQGFHATSMQDLVSHLGISRSSLYESFDSKKELYDEALDVYCKEAREKIIGILKQETSAKQGIRKLLDSGIACSLRDPARKGCFAVNTTTELLPNDDELAEALSKNRAFFEDTFYEFLFRAQQSGEIPPGKDLRSLAGLIYTLFSGLSVIAKIEPEPEQLISQVDLMLELLD